jgi:transcriptional regulator with XRE-family HTH domain
MKRRWFFLLIGISLIVVGATSGLWFTRLIRFVTANANLIQGLASLVQLVLWCISAVVLWFGVLRKPKPEWKNPSPHQLEKVVDISPYLEGDYEAGVRIKTVREELGLKTSQIAELLKVHSQREFEAMESGNIETPLSVLENLHVLAGVSINWLKHGDGPRYRVHSGGPLRRIEIARHSILRIQPKEIILTLGTENLDILFIVGAGNTVFP